jgi:phosphodiesterase/alkaline phosphatase D-like protein
MINCEHGRFWTAVAFRMLDRIGWASDVFRTYIERGEAIVIAGTLLPQRWRRGFISCCFWLVIAVVLAFSVGSARATTQTFYYTGGEQAFTVPAGVISIQVAAIGGHGGSSTSAPGGEAAEVTAELPVTPDQTLYVEVAGNGQSEQEGGAGGFNGGGDSGPSPKGGGGGGGASDLRAVSRSGGLVPDTRLIIAAGGGGAGGSAGCGYPGGSGGAAGQNGGQGSCDNGGGTAGTLFGGGLGTDGGDCGTGQAGELGVGGSGSGSGYAGPPSTQAYCAQSTGGGGGGGLYGGAGGSGGDSSGGGGGGGGSSLIPNGGTVSLSGAQPQVQVSYTYSPGPRVSTISASNISQTTATLNATVNPEDEEVTDCHFEYGPSPSYGTSIPCVSSPPIGASAVPVTATVNGLNPNSIYYFRIVATSASGTNDGSQDSFTTLPNPPVVVTNPPISVAHTSATLQGAVDPEGGEVNNCYFEYGTTASFGSTAPCSSPPGSGVNPIDVSAELTGIDAGTSYYYRIVAENVGGVSYGAERTFTTPTSAPIVAIEEPTVGVPGEVTLRATVNPEGQSITDCHFEYGTVLPYEASIPCSPAPGPGRVPVSVTAELSGLDTRALYHYRIVATNSSGTTDSDDQTIATFNRPETVSFATRGCTTWTAPISGALEVQATGASGGSGERGGSGGAGALANGTIYGTVGQQLYVCVDVGGGPGASSAYGYSGGSGGGASGVGLGSNFSQPIVIAGGGGGGGGRVRFGASSGGAAEERGGGTASYEQGGGGGAASAFEPGIAGQAGYEGYLGSGGSQFSPSGPGVGGSGGVGSPNCGPCYAAGGGGGGGGYYGGGGGGGSGFSGGGGGGGSSLVPAGGSVTLAPESAAAQVQIRYGAAPEVPVSLSAPASAVAQTTARVNGSVNPDGQRTRKCEFEYGTTSSYGSTIPCSSLPGNGESFVAVDASLIGLAPYTVYHFRIVTMNATGTSYSSDQSFMTLPEPPTIAAVAATSITQTSLTLNATVNPNGPEVSSCTIEYGPSVSYGDTIPCSPLPGVSTSPLAVSAAIVGLHANSSYDYRVVATNAGGSDYQPNQTVRTLPNPPSVETGGYLGSTSTLTGAVIPDGGEITSCMFEYGNTRLYGRTVSCAIPPGAGETVVEVSAQPPGLVPGQTYHYRLVAVNAGGTSDGSEQTFIAASGPPITVTGSATSITQTTATLNGGVNPDSSEVTECEIEYGLTAGYGAAAPCATLPGAGANPVAVSAQVGGLVANTVYHFRVIARNSSRTGYGGDETFRTLPDPPAAFTGSAEAITSTSATLNAEVDPDGAEVTSCVIAYGTTTTYGDTAPCTALPEASTGPVAVTALLSGLAPGTRYHYRILATNSGGTGEGADESFSTLPPGRAPTIARLSVKKGPAAGGTPLTITGTGFIGAATVKFGPVLATSVSVLSSTAILVESPPGTSGKTEVTVTTADGTSGISKGAQYTYGIPTITRLTPDLGSLLGEIPVLVEGSGFGTAAGTSFTFGKGIATTTSCANTTSCMAIVPAASQAGSVEVIATVGKDKSKKSPPGDVYTYE